MGWWKNIAKWIHNAWAYALDLAEEWVKWAWSWIVGTIDMLWDVWANAVDLWANLVWIDSNYADKEWALDKMYKNYEKAANQYQLVDSEWWKTWLGALGLKWAHAVWEIAAPWAWLWMIGKTAKVAKALWAWKAVWEKLWAKVIEWILKTTVKKNSPKVYQSIVDAAKVAKSNKQPFGEKEVMEILKETPEAFDEVKRIANATSRTAWLPSENKLVKTIWTLDDAAKESIKWNPTLAEALKKASNVHTGDEKIYDVLAKWAWMAWKVWSKVFNPEKVDASAWWVKKWINATHRWLTNKPTAVGWWEFINKNLIQDPDGTLPDQELDEEGPFEVYYNWKKVWFATKEEMENFLKN